MSEQTPVLPYSAPPGRPPYSGIAIGGAAVAGASVLLTLLAGITLDGGESMVWWARVLVPVNLLTCAAAVWATQKGTRRGNFLALAPLAVGLLLIPAALRPSNPMRVRVNQIKCMSNLRQIGQALTAYANNQGSAVYPDDMLVAAEMLLDPECLVCPASNDSKAPGPTTAAWVQQVPAGPHLSYTYIGGGVRLDSNPAVLIAYETRDNHDGGSVNVLWSNGAVNTMARSHLNVLLKPTTRP